MAERPTLEEVRAWLDVAQDEITDDDLADILEGETDEQNAWCELPETYPPAARLALFRRCARAAAARGLPLGTLPPPSTGTGAEYGAIYMPRNLDGEIERYEARWRVIAIA